MKIVRFIALTFMCVVVATVLVTAQTVKEPEMNNPEWSKPYQPFRIVGNLYYVGTYDLACYLIVTPKGNILINTGLAASTSIIRNNIELLGFKLDDTKILLTTQAHFDHVGALAEIKKLTGAKMMVDEKDAVALADGGASDYEMGKYGRTFEPVNVDHVLKDGESISLGDTRLVMLHHPGHTKGSCSFMIDVKDENKTYKVLIANMPSIITKKGFTEIPAYPEIGKDYAYSFSAMKKLTFDLWLSSHASQFGLHEKHKPGDPYNPMAFNGRKDYDESLKGLEEVYLRKKK